MNRQNSNGEEPLILNLLRLLVPCLLLPFRALAFPFSFFLSKFQNSIIAVDDIASSRLKRSFVSIITFLLFIVTCCGGIFVGTFMNNQYAPDDKKIKQITQIVVGAFSGIIDFLVFSMTQILILPCFWRWRHLYRKPKNDKLNWRLYLLQQIPLALFDIIVFPFFLIAFVFFWRNHFHNAIWKHYNEYRTNVEHEMSELKIRIFTMEQAFRGLGELIFIPIPLLFILVTIYRVSDTWEELKGADEDDRKFIIWNNFLKILKDIPFIILGFVLVCTGYRGILLFLDLYKSDNNAVHRRKIVTYHCLQLLLDILILIEIPFILIFFYRIPLLFSDLSKNKRRGFTGSYLGKDNEPVEWEPSVLMIYSNQLRSAFLDIPFIILAIASIPFIWRWKIILISVKNLLVFPSNEVEVTRERRQSILDQFKNGVIDSVSNA